jgi:tetratricopeptide (TPR) repeat protein
VKGVLPVVLVAALSALAYVNAVPRVLVHDDHTALVQNPRFGGVERIPQLFAESAWEGIAGNRRLYRPLALATLSVDRTLFGGDPRGYHWTSIGLHVLATLTVFALLGVLGAGWPGAFLGAVLFGVHPVHTEAVDVAFNRSEILACLFVVSAVAWVLYLIDRRPALAFSGASVLYLLALLCRESAVTLPLVLLLALALFRPGKEGEDRARAFWPVLWLALPLLLYVVLRGAALGEAAGGLLRSIGPEGIGGAGDPAHRLGLVAATLRDSMRLLVLPWPLQASYEDYVPRAIPAAVLLHAALLAAAVAARRRMPALSFGIAFFYVTLLPSTRLFADPAVMAERFLYLPSVGLAVPVAFALTRWAARQGPRLPIAAAAVAAILLVRLTWQRNADWQSAEALWEAEARVSAGDWRALLNLSQIRIRQGRLDEALALSDQGLAIDPSRAAFHTNRGIALLSLGRNAEAEAALLRAAEAGGDPAAWANMGRLYATTGRSREADAAYAKAMAAEPDAVADLVLEGERRLLVGQDTAGAREAFEKALAIAPHHPAARQALRLLPSAGRAP